MLYKWQRNVLPVGQDIFFKGVKGSYGFFQNENMYLQMIPVSVFVNVFSNEHKAETTHI